MSSSTQSEPSNAATVRSDVPCLARDRALPSIPSNARAHEVSLEHQLGALDSSFQRPVLTIQTKRNLVCGGKFLRSHHTYAEPPDLSRNRQSLPPPYAAVDPNAPPRASRTVRWALALILHWTHHPIPAMSPLLADKLQVVVSVASSAGAKNGSRARATNEQISYSRPTHQIMIHTSRLDSHLTAY
ncbi:hypothetical protein IW261DRAFT_1564102 [Armillaria novae-zelandiae]|uniref:Uncharacterized protein n=1 Tax=Armillaria novae-zelandiae TaxID=153914 RepID=A0AA39PAR5_9AGAR|nr:hypothetical protein IW261DRAFT_1564102 [Armillaria novae-zelandiae]